MKTNAPVQGQSLSCPAGASPGRMPHLSELGDDLLVVSWWRRVVSLALPFACVVAYFALALHGHWAVAVAACMVMSFITYGSVSHDLVHGNLRLNRRVNDWLLATIELLAIRSGHAYRLAHLHHHASFPSDDDVEAGRASRGALAALVDGFTRVPRICWWALRGTGAHRRWVAIECVGCIAIIVASIFAWRWSAAPLVYITLMVAGTWIFPLVTVHVPHNRDASDALQQTRLFRGTVLAVIAAQHLYHLEHHLYSQVPHHNWPALARRLDPIFARAGLRPIRLFF